MRNTENKHFDEFEHLNVKIINEIYTKNPKLNGRMASAARLGASGGADLSSEAVTKDADATQAASQGTSDDDGPAGGTSAAAAAAATSMTTAAQQHPNLIGTIVGKMAKIQREGRGRRYRVSFLLELHANGRSN